MPIDTSSYYPEVPGSGEGNDSFSLNRTEGGLFGPSKPTSPPPPPPAPENNGKQENDSKDVPPVGRKATDRVAEILSWIFVPLLMPVYGLILAFSLSILDVAPMGMRVVFTLIVFGIDVVVPMVLIYFLKRFGIVDDLGLNGRKERLVPYIITIVCYLATAWFICYKGAPLWLGLFFVGGALAGGVNLVVNFWWKISAHSAGIAGIVALLIRIVRDGSPEPEIFTWILLSIVAAGLLGSARVWLGRHTVWQVFAGYAVGYVCVFFLMGLGN